MFKTITDWFKRPMTLLLLCVVLVSSSGYLALHKQYSLIGGETPAVKQEEVFSEIPTPEEVVEAKAEGT